MRRGEYNGKPARGAKRARTNRRRSKTYEAIHLAMTNQWFIAGLMGHYDSRTWGKTPDEARKAIGWK